MIAPASDRGGTPTPDGQPPRDLFTPEIVRNQLQRVLASRPFGQARRLSRVLQLMVEAALTGQRNLDEYALGIGALQKPESFDPRVDPSVRVHTRRLRIKLRTYYQADGRDDALMIVLPPRTYVPVFQLRSQARIAALSPELRPATRNGSRLAIVPFTSLSNGKEDENFADGLTQEVIHAVMRMADVRLIVCNRTSGAVFADAIEMGRRASAKAVLRGTVRLIKDQARISTELVSVHDGSVVWSNMYENSVKAPHLIATQESAAQTLALAVLIWLTNDGARASLVSRSGHRDD